MARESLIIELAHWWQSPPGRYLLDWEQTQLDHLVADVFGFHATQLGLPQLHALRANRMPHRWLATDVRFTPQPPPLQPGDGGPPTLAPGHGASALHCDFDALPFPNQSLDLVVLPHTLELARDPHDSLREVERVLVPEGRVVIVGFNPNSLWGLRQRLGHARQGVGLGGQLFLPSAGEFIGYGRARDWLRLLGFEVQRGRFGCWRPPLRSAQWLQRCGWMDSAGQRAWPVLGAVYALEAVKRVRGVRLVGLARQRLSARASSPAVVANRRREAAAPLNQTVELLEQD